MFREKMGQTSKSRMTRRELLKLGLYAGAAAGLPGSVWLSGCQKKQHDIIRPTNVILISLDTLRADYLSSYGCPRATSPNLDKVASQGLLFEDVSTSSPWTLPAHLSMLTGMYPSRHGVDDILTKLPDHIPLLSSVLSQNGFATASIVNYWLLRKEFGFDRGFDHYARLEYSDKPEGVASAIIEQAVEWIRGHSRDPFFVFLHFFDVHSSYTALPRYKEQFVHPYNGTFTGTSQELVPFSPQLIEGKEPKAGLNQDDVDYLSDLYAASIRQIDDDLVPLFSFLEEQTLFDQTLLIVTSDHGEEFYEHGGLSHGYTHYQEVLHVPLIMRGPGLPRGLRIRETASIVDIVPTVLGLLGIAAPPLQNGIDLSCFWQKGDIQAPQRYIFSEADIRQMTDPYDKKNNTKRTIRHPRYKLHYNLLSMDTKLYDLHNDPQEKTDVTAAHPSLLNMLFSELEKFMKIRRTGRRLPKPTQKEIKGLKSLGYL